MTFLASRLCGICARSGQQFGDNEGQWNLDTIVAPAGFNWSNKASSVRTYNYCDVRLWDAVGCPSSGAKTPWIDISSNLQLDTNWSNRASASADRPPGPG